MSYLAEQLQNKIRETNFKVPPLDDLIISKILSLIFGFLEKIWHEYEIYLLPYIKSVKGLSIIEDVIKKTH